MNTIDFDDFSIRSQSQIDEDNALALRDIIAKGEEKKERVIRFIAANPGWDMKSVASRFGLDWSVEKDFGNGIGRISFYSDCSMRIKVCDTHDSIGNWFRV